MENLLKKVLQLKKPTKSQIKLSESNLDKFIKAIENKDVDTVIYIVQNLLTDKYNSAIEEVEYVINTTVNNTSTWDYGNKDTCECGHAKNSHHSQGQISYPDSTRCVHCICKMYLPKK